MYTRGDYKSNRENQFSQGASSKWRISSYGKDDELTKALGNEEHYGRVRGVGRRVGHKQYYDKRRRGGGRIMSNEGVEKLTEDITQRVEARLIQDITERVKTKLTQRVEANMLKKFQQGTLNISQHQGICGNISCSVERDSKEGEVEMNFRSGNDLSYENDDEPDPFNTIPEKGVECALAVRDIEYHKVAVGRVFQAPTQDSRSHCVAFGANECRVSIDVVMEGEEDTLLPLPNEEFSTVGEANGSFVRWPRKSGFALWRKTMIQLLRLKAESGRSLKVIYQRKRKAKSGRRVRVIHRRN